MLIEYGSLFYFLYLFLPVGLTVLLTFLFRKKSLRAQKGVVLAVLLLNVFQHIFKLQIYPQYDGGFSPIVTAYNMCAFLILFSPVAFFSKRQGIKDCVCILGTAAGLGAMLFPTWFLGLSAFSWEICRFYICHGLLLTGSVLPLSLGFHRFSRRSVLKIPFFFLFAQAVILCNDALLICAGYYGSNLSTSDVFACLYRSNPCWTMHPGPLPWLNEIILAFCPAFFTHNAAGETFYWPILWCALPLILGMWILGIPLSFALDFKGIKEDWHKANRVCKGFVGTIKDRFLHT